MNNSTLEGCLENIGDGGRKENVPKEDSVESCEDGRFGVQAGPSIIGKMLIDMNECNNQIGGT